MRQFHMTATGLGTSAARIDWPRRGSGPDASPQQQTFDPSPVDLGSSAALDAPPGFPPSIPVRRQTYRNWIDQIHVDDVWTCAPRSSADVVTLANWARRHGYQVRASGNAHTASPLVLTDRQPDAERVILADTRQHLTQMSIAPGSSAEVRVGTGASVTALLEYLERHGYGLLVTPAMGEITVGGALAVGAHGTGVPAGDEPAGTMSDLIVTLTAVVWDGVSGAYVLRTFHRADPDSAAFLVQLGRAFITDVTLAVVPNYNLRCVSEMTVGAGELLAAPELASPRSLAAYVDACGRVNVLWFPYSDRTWLKTLTVEPHRPPQSRVVTEPYNYPFADHVPESVSRAVSLVVSEDPANAVVLGEIQYAAAVAGLAATGSADLWGPSKNLLLHSRPTILRYTWGSYAILTRRLELQRVVHEYGAFYRALLDAYRDQGKYPMNGPVHIRVTGLDRPRAAGDGQIQPPALSPVVADPEHPEWDVAIWVDALSFPDTPHAEELFRELEQFIFSHYRAPYALARPEWSKGWAYTTKSGWSDPTMLDRTLPAAFGGSWSWAVDRLNAHDPHRVFSNPLLDRLLVKRSGA
jgi:FAD/FMN-containing dehydrogenase